MAVTRSARLRTYAAVLNACVDDNLAPPIETTIDSYEVALRVETVPDLMGWAGFAGLTVEPARELPGCPDLLHRARGTWLGKPLTIRCYTAPAKPPAKAALDLARAAAAQALAVAELEPVDVPPAPIYGGTKVGMPLDDDVDADEPLDDDGPCAGCDCCSRFECQGGTCNCNCPCLESVG